MSSAERLHLPVGEDADGVPVGLGCGRPEHMASLFHVKQVVHNVLCALQLKTRIKGPHARRAAGAEAPRGARGPGTHRRRAFARVSGLQLSCSPRLSLPAQLPGSELLPSPVHPPAHSEHPPHPQEALLVVPSAGPSAHCPAAQPHWPTVQGISPALWKSSCLSLSAGHQRSLGPNASTWTVGQALPVPPEGRTGVGRGIRGWESGPSPPEVCGPCG